MGNIGLLYFTEVRYLWLYKPGRTLYKLLPGSSFVWKCSQTSRARVGPSEGEYYSEDAVTTGWLARQSEQD